MKIINTLSSILVLLGTIVVEGADPEHYVGEAYLQTVDPINDWSVRKGIVKTELGWFDEIAQKYSISELRTVDLSCQVNLNFYHVTFDEQYNIYELNTDFNQNVEVVESWPVMIPEWYGIPDDPLYSNQWGLEQIDAPEAWDYESGNSSVIIGILDSGSEVEYDADPSNPIHPDLETNLWNNNGLYGIDLWLEGTPPDDGYGHGSHISGIVGAITDNGIGVSGMAGGGFSSGDGVTLLIVRNGGDAGNTTEELLAESICQALNPDGDWNTDDWVDVINMSWGARRQPTNPPSSWQQAFPLFKLAVDEAYNRNVIMVAAAGNDGEDFTQLYAGDRMYWPYPAGYDQVITVAASSITDEQVSYSNEGTFIDVAAPGGAGPPFDSDDIMSTTPRDPFWLNTHLSVNLEYGYLAGTSMATPYVTGLVGLLLSRFPSSTPEDVREYLRQSAEKTGSNSYDGNGWNKYLGYGRINAFYAVAPPAQPANLTLSGSFGQSPQLSWDANSEPDLKKYYIYRRQGSGGSFINIGNTTSTSFTDTDIMIGPPMATWYYYVKAKDISNQYSQASNQVYTIGMLKELIPSEEIELPQRYALFNNYPNPFNPTTSIRFDLPEKSRVTMVVYDILGKEIKKLVSGELVSGYHKAIWDGKDDNGSPLPSGMYIYRFSAISEESEKRFRSNKKLVLMK